MLPRRACALTFALLLVKLERVEAAGGEGDAAFGGPRLGGQRGQPACAGPLKGAADGGGACIKVEVLPVQAQKFALAEPGVESKCEQGGQSVVLGGGEESAGFVGGEGFEASGPWGAGADVAGDVARDFLFADGVLQGGQWDTRVAVERYRRDLTMFDDFDGGGGGGQTMDDLWNSLDW
ncbi:hypothetical protein GCM10009654_24650 [Streptomyces hebeiensis]|uniref:Uncharacterized protein n=1 Tax=Streptomyces hebeiensis TaxID=229486 RepID=A0ABN1USW4_9ACTN